MSPTSVNGTPLPLHETDDLDQVITVLRQHVHALSERSARAPGAVRLSARGVELEMTWPDVALPQAGEHPRTVAAEPAPAAAPVEAEPDAVVLRAETVGVFYRAPEPGAKPFVEEGDAVEPGTQIAIVEAMKLMIPVEADRAGTVLEVLVADGESVEHGQPLMKLAPAEPGGTPR
ncbi:acetyl-CoA carboxylase biotin carboxyl carrier protein [Saccharopolyspora mangrovi]|uniref:Biotin carboxyl carrier protein of acetyl-CoA carboxylase n=1 Tax=Saccharopolyspora mangrovi TaxID=3082379 RepID=A0ABU6AHF4_9PSEU|nr:biotin/lipoyl-containing protein [Saccharopolyspora sp. S2-29]MEB3370987.1 biotin/lipoyl-containing protein [Saccharopolyspora sp. S2-29]